MEIITGTQITAPTMMIYGLTGAGKSTLAATLTKPVFLDIEGGIRYINVAKTKTTIKTAEEFFGCLLDFTHATKREYDYIVIDSVDWLVKLFEAKVSGAGQGKTLDKLLESANLTLNGALGGYGKGAQALENYVRTVLVKILKLLNDKGYGIVFIAHADRKTLLDADGTNIERLAPKMDIKSMNIFMEYVDNLFYLKRDDDGVRHLIVNPTDTVTAKNRIGIQETEFVVDDKFSLEALVTTGKPQKGEK